RLVGADLADDSPSGGPWITLSSRPLSRANRSSARHVDEEATMVVCAGVVSITRSDTAAHIGRRWSRMIESARATARAFLAAAAVEASRTGPSSRNHRRSAPGPT